MNYITWEHKEELFQEDEVCATFYEKFYTITFLSQILAMVIFCFPLISMKGTASVTFVKLLFIERYK